MFQLVAGEIKLISDRIDSPHVRVECGLILYFLAILQRSVPEKVLEDCSFYHPKGASFKRTLNLSPHWFERTSDSSSGSIIRRFTLPIAG